MTHHMASPAAARRPMSTPAAKVAAEADQIRCQAAPMCPLCGAAGTVRHAELTDRLFAAPGSWTLRECGSAACGLLWLDPMPLAADLGKAYAQYFTHTDPSPQRHTLLHRLVLGARRAYLAAHHAGPAVDRGTRLLGLLPWLHPGWRAELRHRAMHLQAKAGGRLLEIGCGSGELLAGVRGLGWRVTGVDFDPVAAEVARRRGLDVRCGDLAGQAFAGGSFDAVTMFHLIEHVPDPRALLAECHRVLAPGGRLVVATPNLRSRGHRRFGAAWLELDPPRHLHLFAPMALQREVERHGFRVESLRTSLRSAAIVAAGSRAIAATGRYHFGSGAQGPFALGFLYWSWLASAWQRLAAEETVLVAVRG